MIGIPSRGCAAAARRVVLGVAVLALAAGCASTVDGSGAPATTGAIPPVPGSATTPPAAPTLPSTLSSAPSSTAVPVPPVTKPAPRPVSRADITDIHYTIPHGFVNTTLFHIDDPLENSYQVKFLLPKGATPDRDVLSIALYRLPAEHLVDTRARQLARIRAYNRRLKVRLLAPLRETVLGGRVAFTEAALQPGGFRYGTWFVFGGRHLANISCQYQDHVKRIESGCLTLLKSVKLR